MWFLHYVFTNDSEQLQTKERGIEVTLWTCIREVSSWNLLRSAGHLDFFHCFARAFYANMIFHSERITDLKYTIRQSKRTRVYSYLRNNIYIKREVTDFFLVIYQRLSKSNRKNAGNKTYKRTLIRNSYGITLYHIIQQGGDMTKTLIWIQLVIGPKWGKCLQTVNLSLCIFLNSLSMYASVRGRGETVLCYFSHKWAYCTSSVCQTRDWNIGGGGEGRTQVLGEKFVHHKSHLGYPGI